MTPSTSYRYEEIIKIYMIPWLTVDGKSPGKLAESFEKDSSGAVINTCSPDGDESPAQDESWRQYGLPPVDEKGFLPVTRFGFLEHPPQEVSVSC